MIVSLAESPVQNKTVLFRREGGLDYRRALHVLSTRCVGGCVPFATGSLPVCTVLVRAEVNGWCLSTPDRMNAALRCTFPQQLLKN